MGMYIYGIRSPKHVTKVKLDTGAIMKVAKYAFAYKPTYSYWEGKEPRWQVLAKARLFRMENIWDAFVSAGGFWPDGGVIVGDDNKVDIGETVMAWPKKSHTPISIEDCTNSGAEYIGKIIEILK